MPVSQVSLVSINTALTSLKQEASLGKMRATLVRHRISKHNRSRLLTVRILRYQVDVNSTELANKLIQEKSVLIVPGDHFGMDRFIRISFGLPRDDQVRSTLQKASP